jgi:hypothetical protein
MFNWNLSISIMTGYGQADWDSKPNRRKGFWSSPSTAFLSKGYLLQKSGRCTSTPLACLHGVVP